MGSGGGTTGITGVSTEAEGAEAVGSTGGATGVVAAKGSEGLTDSTGASPDGAEDFLNNHPNIVSPGPVRRWDQKNPRQPTVPSVALSIHLDGQRQAVTATQAQRSQPLPSPSLPKG